ncbi:protocadherin Fat 3a isoform X1 [Lates japonicus]|uniref:Protocadherin Fat 3a isoform X1 n=1 Tax=Lates japonicus TaxID=270547 RepID=A0AAD3MFQ9_LATJO|nr:protocadherin Fat 3a isoform X1 [Lates japonicus]
MEHWCQSSLQEGTWQLNMLMNAGDSRLRKPRLSSSSMLTVRVIEEAFTDQWRYHWRFISSLWRMSFPGGVIGQLPHTALTTYDALTLTRPPSPARSL